MQNQYLIHNVPNAFFNLSLIFKTTDLDKVMQCEFFTERELNADSIFDYDHPASANVIAKNIELNSIELHDVLKNLIDAQIEADIFLSEPDVDYSDYDYSDLDYDVVIRKNKVANQFYATTYERREETIAYELNQMLELLIQSGFADAAKVIEPRIHELHCYGWVSAQSNEPENEINLAQQLIELLENHCEIAHQKAEIQILHNHTYVNETESQGSMMADILVKIGHDKKTYEFCIPAYVYLKRHGDNIELEYDPTDIGSLEASYESLYPSQNFSDVSQSELEALDKLVDEKFNIRNVPDWSKQLIDSIQWENWDLGYLVKDIPAYQPS